MIERYGDVWMFDWWWLMMLMVCDVWCVDVGECDECDGIDWCVDGVIGVGVGDDVANSEVGGDDDVRERGGVRGVGDVCGVYGCEWD